VRKNTLTATYAQAAYEAATDVWVRTLAATNEAIEKTPGLLMSLRDPGLELYQKQEMAAQVIPADAPQAIRNFVSVLLSHNDIGLLPEIVDELRRLATHGPRAQLVKVTSAVALTDAEREAVAEKLAEQYGQNLAFEYQVDPSLLGGLILRVGDRVIDASVAGKLHALRERLVQEL
jgi:F-type H+-transporting ATPase subunit delta